MAQKYWIADRDVYYEREGYAPVWVANKGDKIKYEVAVNLGLVKAESAAKAVRESQDEDKAVRAPRGSRKK